jgi:Flp pilus assembly protein TadG
VRPGRPAAASGQATAELALALPFVMVLVLGLVQAALVLRDELALVQAAREAARAASVEADPAAPRAAADEVLPGAVVRVGARPPPGALIRVEVAYRSTTDVPIVGRLLPDPELSARAVMRVER